MSIRNAPRIRFDRLPHAARQVVPHFGTNFHTSFMPVIARMHGGHLLRKQPDGLGAGGQKAIPAPGDVAVCNSVAAGHAVSRSEQALLHFGSSGRCCAAVHRWIRIGDRLLERPASTAGPAAMAWAALPSRSAHARRQSEDHGLTEPSPYPPATLTVFVFEDDFRSMANTMRAAASTFSRRTSPALAASRSPSQDDAGGTGDATGTATYDMFNMPLSNSLAGTIDPATVLDACPLSQRRSPQHTRRRRRHPDRASRA